MPPNQKTPPKIPPQFEDHEPTTDEDKNKDDTQETTEHPENNGVNEFEEDEIAEDEVIITSDDKGEIMACASQVTNYRLRSTLYKNLTSWDHITQVDKIKKT